MKEDRLLKLLFEVQAILVDAGDVEAANAVDEIAASVVRSQIGPWMKKTGKTFKGGEQK